MCEIESASSIESIIDLRDKHKTCEYNKDDPYAAIQKHKHTQTCYRGGKNKSVCRFNFPLPVMPRTCILKPLLEDDKSEEIKKNLQKNQ